MPMKSFTKKTVKINTEFICQNCGEINSPAQQTCRNHCHKCLYSKHVDLQLPGDRLSKCGGLMEPVSVLQNSKKGFQISHRCLKCGKTIFNKAAPDDNVDQLIAVMKKQNLNY